jgi:hypothetical protein
MPQTLDADTPQIGTEVATDHLDVEVMVFVEDESEVVSRAEPARIEPEKQAEERPALPSMRPASRDGPGLADRADQD